MEESRFLSAENKARSWAIEVDPVVNERDEPVRGGERQHGRGAGRAAIVLLLLISTAAMIAAVNATLNQAVRDVESRMHRAESEQKAAEEDSSPRRSARGG